MKALPLGEGWVGLSGAAGSFLFGTFSFAEKEKVHPLTLIMHFTEPNEVLRG
ncbi:hypothetical protein [Mucilaginibacter hurinus]|uniref:hypothetical protein n=1 Tax=Mucilaginibacter hurinus TaxID=2201324 RepID=UPI0013143B18|nr:hypothetical protein [Mucilaginibacter hurinus]